MSNVSIEKLDKNLAIAGLSGDESLAFYDPEEAPFKMYGVYREGDCLVRMPGEIAKTVNRKVAVLYLHTAGGRIKFRTDSTTLAVKATMHNRSIFSHQPAIGTAGFDVYEKDDELGDVYISSFKPPVEQITEYEGKVKLGEKKMRDITLTLPLYSGIKKLYLGLDTDATVECGSEYSNSKPIVFYGSSITQGACASKPSDSYEALISRRFNMDYINLGFSGSACAEENIYNYINTLDMSIFVYDYDHNAKDPDHLNRTHERMFLAIREKHPTLPIIMMGRPRYHASADTKARLEIIKRTYDNALARGDENVYFLTGRDLMALCGPDGMADEAHPTSLGFFSMAKAVGDVIENIISKNPKKINRK